MDGLICTTAISKWNIESKLLVLLCEHVLVSFYAVIICFKEYIIAQFKMQPCPHFSFFWKSRSDSRRNCISSPGNTWTWPGSGSWIIRRLAQCLSMTTIHTSPRVKEHWLSITAEVLARHIPILKRVIWLEKHLRHCTFALLYIEGFYCSSSPRSLSKLAEIKGSLVLYDWLNYFYLFCYCLIVINMITSTEVWLNKHGHLREFSSQDAGPSNVDHVGKRGSCTVWESSPKTSILSLCYWTDHRDVRRAVYCS